MGVAMFFSDLQHRGPRVQQTSCTCADLRYMLAVAATAQKGRYVSLCFSNLVMGASSMLRLWYAAYASSACRGAGRGAAPFVPNNAAQCNGPGWPEVRHRWRACRRGPSPPSR